MASFEKKQNGEEKPGFSKSLVMYLHDLCWMLAVVMILFLIFFRIIVVSGPSMKMTLLDGDYLLLISNLFYREPEKGDVVVVSKQDYDNGKPIVKRVIATEGQIVDMDFANGIVYVDGLPLEEDYINTPTNLDEGSVFPQIVEEDHVFVMGDNRNNSKDSRSLEIGQVDKREVLGKVALLMVPGTDHGAEARDVHRIGTVK
ncbi:MAG: signal peptidase I [Candidatus Faecousia sp.]|nr:signal peptidase I [Oscillospiraceae bacterium]MDY2557282.1 signal peptidase I [Candidatus Faecousia sp.]